MKKHVIDEFCDQIHAEIRDGIIQPEDITEVIYNSLADYVDLAEMIIKKKIYISCWDYYNDCDLPTKEAKNVKKAIKLIDSIREQERLDKKYKKLINKRTKNDN